MSAAALLARAFQEDPYFRWVDANAPRRMRMLETVFEAMLKHSARRGGVLIEPGIGAVEWKPPEHVHLGVGAIISSGMWRVGVAVPPSVSRRLARHDDAAMARVEPFLGPATVYLGSFGVEPALAGQGHGGRLLHRALAEMATRWTTCVLRTEQPRNVPFYLRHGFTLVDEAVVAPSGLRVWVFSRPLERPVPPGVRPGDRALSA